VAVSRALKEKMVEAGGEPDRIAVIQNGVDTTLFHPAADRRAVRRALDMPREEILLFSAGGLAEAKGFQDLIAGLALLPPEPPLHLYIAGDGPYRKALKQLIRERQLKDRVTLLKTIPQTKMAPWYQAADFFCFGSWREGCPNAVLEALACGTPVVSTRVGAVPDLVAEERSGLLFEPGASGDRSSGAAEAFAATMKQALARTWDRAAIAARGSRRSWDHVAAEYCAVFEQAVASWEPVA
jgi:glycosyltransferase involved in cell wall biosynthesis